MKGNDHSNNVNKKVTGKNNLAQDFDLDFKGNLKKSETKTYGSN